MVKGSLEAYHTISSRIFCGLLTSVSGTWNCSGPHLQGTVSQYQVAGRNRLIGGDREGGSRLHGDALWWQSSDGHFRALSGTAGVSIAS